ncbi:MAG: ribbon-helix-helix protein, CopG family [Acidobacteriota bacterium]
MGASIEIEPELIEKLSEKAKAHGQTVNELLRELLDAVEPLPTPAGFSSLEELEADLDALAEGTEHLPPLPENFSREDIYFDHD